MSETERAVRIYEVIFWKVDLIHICISVLAHVVPIYHSIFWKVAHVCTYTAAHQVLG